MKRNYPILLPILLCPLMSGCAGIMTQRCPDISSPVNVTVQAGEDEHHHLVQDWPPGTYRIPNSNIFVANVQGDQSVMVAGALFGLVGVAIAGGNIAGDAKKQIAGLEQKLTLNLPEMAENDLEKSKLTTANNNRFVLSDKDGEFSLRIIPYMVLSFVGDQTARLWVVLKAYLMDNNFNGTEWKCRYIAGLGKPRPFKGEDSWSSIEPEELQAEAEEDTQEAIRVMVEDLHGGLRNEKVAKEKVEGCWVFYKKPREVDGKFLFTNDQEAIVLPMVGDDEYFAGINILPRDFFPNRQQ